MKSSPGVAASPPSRGSDNPCHMFSFLSMCHVSLICLWCTLFHRQDKHEFSITHEFSICYA